MDILSRKLRYFWSFAYIFAIIIFLLQHYYFGRLHYHECDSSGVYSALTEVAFDSQKMQLFINRISPNVLTEIRYIIADLSEYINFSPLKTFFQLPYLYTYPPLMGLFYGFIPKETYDQFYYLASFLNGLALVLSSFFLYLTTRRLNLSSGICFMSSTILLTLYGTNSYSYHLGSTIWYVLSISIGIFMLTVKNDFVQDIVSGLLILMSYPYIVWLLNILVIKLFLKISKEKLNNKYLFKSIIRILRTRYITFSCLIFDLILFYPFDSGYRGGPDIRGIFSIFSFYPQYESLDFISILISLIIYSACFIAILRTFKYYKTGTSLNTNLYQKINNISKSKMIHEVTLTCTTFICLFIVLVLVKKLTLTTSRHTLFNLPVLLILSSIGIETVLRKFQINFPSKIVYRSLSIGLISLCFVVSNQASIKRIDVLKQIEIPYSIRKFVNQPKNITYSIVGCGYQYKYVNFKDKVIRYDLKEPHPSSELFDPGIKLLISQEPLYKRNELSEYLSYNSKIEEGVKIEIPSQGVDISIVSEPLIIKSDVFFDAINSSSVVYNLYHSLDDIIENFINIFGTLEMKERVSSRFEKNRMDYEWYSKATGQEYRLSRPNNIWLIPIEVTQAN